MHCKKYSLILGGMILAISLVACANNDDPKVVAEEFLSQGDYELCGAEVDLDAAEAVYQRVTEAGGFILAETSQAPLEDENGRIIEILYLIYAANNSSPWEITGEAGTITISREGRKYYISAITAIAQPETP